MATPAAKAIGKERNPATSAAAMAARTRFVIVRHLQLDDRRDEDRRHAGERRAQRPVGRRDAVRREARVLAARWFSATAVVAKPKRL